MALCYEYNSQWLQNQAYNILTKYLHKFQDIVK